MQNLERKLVLYAELLCHGVEAAGEIVDHDGGEVQVHPLLEGGVVDMVREGADKGGDVVFGLGIAALNAEWQLAVLEGHVADEGLG